MKRLDVHATVEVAVRTWEFDAKDEDEVRLLLQEAYDQNLEGVRGFRLRSIEALGADTARALGETK